MKRTKHERIAQSPQYP
ncbi:hypothetical protein [Pseudomonas sp. G2-4]